MRAVPSLIVVLLSCLLIAVAALAFASPRDPTWIPGVYDLGDFDDVLDVLLDNGSAPFDGPAIRYEVFPVHVRIVASHAPHAFAVAPLDPSYLRSPPVA